MYTFEVIVVIGILFIIFTAWVCIVLTRRQENKYLDPILEELKLEAKGPDNIINRKKLSDLIRDAIISGKWSP